MSSAVVRTIGGTLAAAASLWLINTALRLISAPSDLQVSMGLVLLGALAGVAVFAWSQAFSAKKD